MVLPTKRKHVSFSEIREHVQCPHLHWLVHVKKIRIFEPNHYSEFGLAMHSACECYVRTGKIDFSVVEKDIRYRWRKNKLPDISDIGKGSFSKLAKKIKGLPNAKKFLSEVDEYVQAGGFVRDRAWFQTAKKRIEESWRDNGLPVLEDIIKGAQQILEELPIFMDLTFPGWELVEAEGELYEKLGFREEDLYFKGFIDAVIKFQKEGETVYYVLDWKASKGPWKNWKRREEIIKYQLIYYREFWRAKNKKTNVKCGFVTLAYDLDLKTARCELIKVEPTEKRRRAALNVLNTMINMVKSKKHKKVKRNRWGSNCVYCKFLETRYCR